ncbi:MAG: restriction endonuclease subunit S [bacterium]
MELKPGYKQSEVGVIPEDWNIDSLASVTPRNAGNGIVDGPFGSNLKTIHYRKSGIPIITSGYVTEGRFVADTYLYVDKEKFEQEKRSTVRPGDIVMAKIGARCGASAILPEWHQIGILSGNAMKITVDTSRHSAFYVWQVLWNLYSTDRIEPLKTVGAQPAISMANLKKYKIAIPPLPEQRAIAAALGDVDALIDALDRLIVKKRDLKQAAMQQLLTGQTRLPGFRGEWEVKRLGDVGDITSAGVDKKSRPGEVPVRLVNYLDVYRKDFIFSDDLNHWVTAPPHQVKRCTVQKGDVFFTPSSETRDDIGISAVAMEYIPDATYSYHVVRLRLRDEWDLRFRTYAFKTRAFLDQAEMLCDGSGTRYVISQGKFKSMTVKVPPLLEQTAIAAVLSDMDTEIAALGARRDKTRALKQGMMQELLTGRTRLV